MRQLLSIIMAISAAIGSAAQAPACDIPFVTRGGDSTSVYTIAREMPPTAQISILLFDPDCDECRAEIDSLASDIALRDSIADGSAAMIALYAAFGPPETDDPNYQKYLTLCTILPSSWTVGCDNGATLDSEAYPLGSGPFLARFPAEAIPTDGDR